MGEGEISRESSLAPCALMSPLGRLKSTEPLRRASRMATESPNENANIQVELR